MRAESLTYFLEIARAGSFSLAARRLFVSQQGLSKAMQSLEKELRVTLFERSGKRLHLSDAGRELVPLAQRYVEDHDAILKTMRKHSIRRDLPESFKLFVMPFVANGLFTLLNDELYARGLKQVILVEKTLSEILEAICAQSMAEAGLAMIGVPHNMLRCLLRNPDLTYEPLFDSSIVLVGTKELISPRKRSISREEVSELPLAYYNEPILENILDRMFSDQPFKNVVMHASNIQFLDEYVRSGRAVSFSDTFSVYVTAKESDLLFIPIEQAITFSVGFVYSAKKGLDPNMADYVDRFKQCIEENCSSYSSKFPCAYSHVDQTC